MKLPTSPRIFTYLAFAGLIACFLLASQMPSTTEYLVVQQSSLDFGEVWSTPDFKWQVVITNPSSRNAEVIRFLSGCKCGRIEPRRLLIPAGGTATIDVYLDLTPGTHEVGMLREKRFEVEIVAVFANRRVRTERWVLRGKVKYPFLVFPPRVVYGGTNELRSGVAPPTSVVTVENVANDLTAVPRVDPQFGTARVTAADPGRCSVEFLPRSDLPTGAFATHLQIDGVSAEGVVLVTMHVPVSGIVAPATIAIPKALHVGAQPIRSTLKEVIVIQGRKGATFATIRATCSLSEIEATLRNEGELNMLPVVCDVSIHVAREGHHAFTIVVVTEDENVRAEIVEISGSYFGVPVPAGT